jgi:ankyrin repeat protein
LLLANKADVNAKDNKGNTPLYFAVEHDYTNVADLLRQRGGI